MTRYRRTFIFVATTVGLASSISLIGGIGLEYIAERLAPLIPLIVALPALNDLVGDYASIIAAHTGDPAERKTSKRKLAIAIYKVLSVNIIAIVVLSVVVALMRGYDITVSFMLLYVGFVIVSTSLMILSVFGITYLLDIILLKKRINPDEVLIPVVTSVADIFMLLMITFAAIFLF